MLTVVFRERIAHVCNLSDQIEMTRIIQLTGLSKHLTKRTSSVLFYLKLKMTLTGLAWHWSKPVWILGQSGFLAGSSSELYRPNHHTTDVIRAAAHEQQQAVYQHFHNSCPTNSAVPHTVHSTEHSCTPQCTLDNCSVHSYLFTSLDYFRSSMETWCFYSMTLSQYVWKIPFNIIGFPLQDLI